MVHIVTARLYRVPDLYELHLLQQQQHQQQQQQQHIRNNAVTVFV
jgi:hypothetical protein